MRAVSEILKCVLFAAVMLLASAAFLLFVGEDTPESDLTFFGWLALKGGSLLAMYLLYRFYILCGRLGLLPAPLMDGWRKVAEPERKEEEGV